MSAPRSISSRELAFVLFQAEGKWYAIAQRALRGELSENQRRLAAAELRETADELDRPDAQVVNPGSTAAANDRAALLWPEVVDSLRTIHLLSGAGAIGLLENSHSAADLYALLMRTAYPLAETAKLAVDNAHSIDEATTAPRWDRGDDE